MACACPEAGCRVFPLLQVTGEAGVPGVGRGGFLLRTVTAVRLALSRFSHVGAVRVSVRGGQRDPG